MVGCNSEKARNPTIDQELFISFVVCLWAINIHEAAYTGKSSIRVGGSSQYQSLWLVPTLCTRTCWPRLSCLLKRFPQYGHLWAAENK